MKKLIFYLILMVWLPARSFGNVIFPQAYISELTFDSLDGWILELKFYDHPDSIFIDSIYMETLSGSSKIASYTAFQHYEGSGYLAVITKDSLVTRLEINANNDLVIVKSYVEGYCYDDDLRLGTYICCIPENHSAVVIPHCTECGGYINPWDCHLLDNSPTIGEINTQDGTEATVYGYVYNADHNPVTNAFLFAYGGFLETDEKGYYYSETVLSRSYSFDTVSLWGTFDTYIYEPVTLQVFPDSTYNQDLVLLATEHYTNIPEILQQEPVITYYPNPFTSETTFYISIPEGISFSTASLEFYDSSGRLVFSAPVKEHRSEVTLSATEIALKPGMYFSLLRLDGKILAKTHSVVKL